MNKTKDEFFKQLNSDPDYKILSEWKTTSDKIELEHLVCNTKWKILPCNFIKGNRCPKCGNLKKGQYLKLTLNDVKKFIKENGNNEYICKSKEYINNKSPLLLKHKICGYEWKISFTNFKSGKRCPNCARFKRKPKSTNEYFLTKFNSQSDSIFYKPLEEYKGTDVKIKFLHLECEQEFQMTPNMFIGKGRRCPYCFKTSNSERRIILFLNQNHIKFEREVKFEGLNSDKGFPLRFDFKIFINENDWFLLEYDGEQHFKSSGFYTEEMVKNLKHNDDIKNNFCIYNNIKLYRISYKEKRNLEDILKKLTSSTTIETINPKKD